MDCLSTEERMHRIKDPAIEDAEDQRMGLWLSGPPDVTEEVSVV